MALRRFVSADLPSMSTDEEGGLHAEICVQYPSSGPFPLSGRVTSIRAVLLESTETSPAKLTIHFVVDNRRINGVVTTIDEVKEMSR